MGVHFIGITRVEVIVVTQATTPLKRMNIFFFITFYCQISIVNGTN